MRLRQTSDFERWYGSLTIAQQTLIISRFDRLRGGHMGSARFLGDGLLELKWRNGMRVYFFRMDESLGIILWGGLKTTQSADIAKARRLKLGCENEDKNE